MMGGDGRVPRAVVVLGRAGLAARGVVYMTIGALAAMAGLGLGGGKVVDQRGAVRFLAGSPFGTYLLWGVALGLAAYVLWRFSQAIIGPRDDGGTAKAIGKRLVAFGSGLAYAGIAATAFHQALGSSGGAAKGGGAQQQGAEFAMSHPLGRWIVAIVGVAVVAAGVAQFRRAYTAKFAKHLKAGAMSAAHGRWACRAGRVGYAARGVAFGIIGSFFLRAALDEKASEAGGLAQALTSLAAHPSGPALLAIVGTGLALFGVYSLIEARYRRIE
ncbi:MAG: DUF1206 domain-containing protein [Verrucomicrobiota bacterium]|nr:DUF1206 domain-containing protein [Verrucomicrobiota bacterium]